MHQRDIVNLSISSLVALATLVNAAPVTAQSTNGRFVWSSVGSVGVPDESSTSLVAFNNASISMRTSAPANAVATIRYQVSSLLQGALFATNFPPEFPNNAVMVSPYTRLTLRALLQKNDDSAYAGVLLKRIRLSDGVISTVAGVNSSFPGPATQMVQRTIACPDGCYSEAVYAYFLEVVLWKPHAASNPAVLALQIDLHY